MNTSAKQISLRILFTTLLVASILSSFNSNASLVTVTEQDVTHTKDVRFAEGIPSITLAGERKEFQAATSATTFNNDWTDSVDYQSMNVRGSSSMLYSFLNDIITFSAETSTSRTGTTNENFTAVSRGSADLFLEFTLSQTTLVELDALFSSELLYPGTAPNLYLEFNRNLDPTQTGLGKRTSPIFNTLFAVSDDARDSVAGDGSISETFSSSALLGPGTYEIFAGAGTQDVYFAQSGLPAQGGSSASMSFTARFTDPTVVVDVSEPSATIIMILAFAGLGFCRRKNVKVNIV